MGEIVWWGFPNYAGRDAIDNAVSAELDEAGIEVIKLPDMLRYGETKTIIIGTLHGWEFRRAWRYWTCRGPGIEVTVAEELHKEFGQEVRVNGNCTCPSPTKQFKGLACGMYHVDTQRGLNALAATIKKIVEKSLTSVVT